ncbi:uncharacterized protein N7458_011174 [Penicillium daleae]|uniref:DUF3752 domain-containing protein n=1 Tax=Penicillium daleae TaxID=63821 RepID=A0AAD6C0L4_9EURO|nr:uncharacterized protein N7458_011174 [Penicillium daleae]KAJ5440176.1 hypothetical protein N7458_011174 [Penicillium daleae]
MEPAEKRKLEAEADGDEPSSKKRVIGPSMPPPQPSDANGGSNEDSHSDSDSDSDDDDDFGPGLPPSLGGAKPTQQTPVQSTPQVSEAHKKESQRDQWMLQPPSSSDWASKIDPTQLRNRKFQTGKSARAPGSKQVDATWVETPEERMRRLQDEVMGVGAAPNRTEQRPSSTKDVARNKEMEEKIKKFNVCPTIPGESASGPSSNFHVLIKIIQEQSGKNTRLEKERPARKEEEDDPSARAFDREKDMAVGSKITSAQRREMVSKASDYGSRFSKGSYL